MEKQEDEWSKEQDDEEEDVEEEYDDDGRDIDKEEDNDDEDNEDDLDPRVCHSLLASIFLGGGRSRTCCDDET